MNANALRSECSPFLSEERYLEHRGLVLGPGTPLLDGRYFLKRPWEEGAVGVVCQNFDGCRQAGAALKFFWNKNQTKAPQMGQGCARYGQRTR